MKQEQELSDGNEEIIGMLPEDRRMLLEIDRNTFWLSSRYKIKPEEILEIAENGRSSIPVNALLRGLAPLESVISYLKDDGKFSINEISNMLGREYKSVWATYRNAKKKKPLRANAKNSGLQIPISAFANSNLGILESAVKFLRENRKMRYSEIALLIKRNERTIWTAYHKAKEKT
ncbi:MAG: hypothetical protein NTV63_04480 [Candidatus Woesearchaeota archaeon]|nr:hypothetical protein [Candidatus Woesearchaeota archaeon]